MPKWFYVGCAVGAAAATYAAFSRRPKDANDVVEAAPWKARDHGTSVGNHSSNDSAGKRL